MPTHHSRPDARDRHVSLALAVKVDGQALGQHAHADLAHGVGGLAAEEAAVDGRADDDDATAAVLAQVGQRGENSGVQALRVDALHELEALEGRVRDGRPEDCARVVDEHVEAAVCLGCQHGLSGQGM